MSGILRGGSTLSGTVNLALVEARSSAVEVGRGGNQQAHVTCRQTPKEGTVNLGLAEARSGVVGDPLAGLQQARASTFLREVREPHKRSP